MLHFETHEQFLFLFSSGCIAEWELTVRLTACVCCMVYKLKTLLLVLAIVNAKAWKQWAWAVASATVLTWCHMCVNLANMALGSCYWSLEKVLLSRLLEVSVFLVSPSILYAQHCLLHTLSSYQVCDKHSLRPSRGTSILFVCSTWLVVWTGLSSLQLWTTCTWCLSAWSGCSAGLTSMDAFASVSTMRYSAICAWCTVWSCDCVCTAYARLWAIQVYCTTVLTLAAARVLPSPS